jgi:hypothetical protein
MILDNYATHTHPDVSARLNRHKRFHLHFTPTSFSWLNLLERRFAELTGKRIQRGVFHWVPEPISAIEHYLAVHNANPRPFVWTATADQIIATADTGKAQLARIESSRILEAGQFCAPQISANCSRLGHANSNCRIDSLRI